MSAPARILVLFAHPAFHRSRVQRALADAVRGLDGVTFHDLYVRYYDFQIDVEREQQLLVMHNSRVLDDDEIGRHAAAYRQRPEALRDGEETR